MSFLNIALVLSVALLSTGLAYADTPQRAWAEKDKIIQLLPPTQQADAITTDDRLAIADSFARWAIAYDDGDFNVIPALFTPNATLEVTLRSNQPIALDKGLPSIVKTLHSVMAQQNDQRRHLITNLVIDPDSKDAVNAIAYALIILTGDQASIGATAVYSASLKRGPNGVWQFSRMVIAMDGYSGHVPKTHH